MIRLMAKAANQVAAKPTPPPAPKQEKKVGKPVAKEVASEKDTDTGDAEETEAPIPLEQDTAADKAGKSANPAIQAAAEAASKAEEEAKQKSRRQELREKMLSERGASPLPKGRFANPVSVTEELLPVLAKQAGADIPEDREPIYRRLATLGPRVAASYMGTETDRGQIFAPKVSRQQVDEGIAKIDRKLADLEQPKADFKFLSSQLKSLNKIKNLVPSRQLGDQPRDPAMGNKPIDRNIFSAAEIAQYQQQGLITDITDSTVTFDGSKVQAQRKQVEGLIEPLREVQRRADLLDKVKQRLEGYVTEGMYGSEQEEE